MTVIPAATGRGDEPASSRPATSAERPPVRADGVELIGEMKGSGYREAPALARRGDGQTLQLTPLLYLVLAEVDGQRECDEVAQRVSAAFGRTVSSDNVRTLVDGQLRPMGLLAKADGSQPEVKKSNPLLALRFKYAVTDPERTRRITAPFARLFHPVVVAVVMAVFAGVCWWVFFRKGLASATYQAFDKPGLLLLVVAVTVLSAGFHEFGHAAAARRGGATPGVMGAGIYLVWPAFYTDVTDSYRLGRGGRVRTDLGGLYFNAIVAVAVAGVWWATGYDALLLLVATQILQMVRQLTPLVRFDGYHVLADVTGVPDLFHRIKPTLLGVLPWRWKHPETTVLKPWARLVVTAWVLVVVPLLAFSLFTMVITLPRILGTAWASVGKQATLLGRAWGDADFLEVAARAVAVVAVVFPILAIAFILTRLVRSVGTSVWRRTQGRPFRRGLAALLAAALVAGLAWMWWPHPGTYRPIQPFEGGTLTQAVSAARSAARPAPSGLVEGQYGRLVTGWADGDPRPTAEEPQLALVLVPRGTQPGDGTGAAAAGATDAASGGTDPAGTAGGSGGEAAVPWVFPFDKPLEPGEGDNQALAVNTTDGTIQYDVAFALVWVEDDSPALNKNEAYAFASCTGCAAVSIGFQVVLVTGDNHVAVPQNISAAVNYDCVNCLTYALATQLFVTLDGPLSSGGVQRITEIWKRIAAFGTNITEVPLSDIRSALTSFEQEILQVISDEQGPLGGAGSAQPVDGPTAAVGSTPGDASSPSASPGASPGADPSSGGTDGTGDGTVTSPDGSGTTTTDPGTTTTDPGAGGTTTTDPGTGGTTTQPGGTATGTDPAPSPAPDAGSDPGASAPAPAETAPASP
jgi:putative peptide zinc metalloprotease protein